MPKTMTKAKTITVKWLTVQEFAEKQGKSPSRIYEWCQTGFVIELGFLLKKDYTGHWRIGVSVRHPAFHEFVA